MSITLPNQPRREFGRLVFSASDSTPNTKLAASLAALGIEPDIKRPYTAVCGDGIRTLRVTWYFAPQSIDGKFVTGEMINAWEDPTFHERFPEHPLSYLKVGFENEARLNALIHDNVPLAMLRRRGKIAFLSTEAPDAIQSKIFKLL